jgi:hypothetical protein
VSAFAPAEFGDRADPNSLIVLAANQLDQLPLGDCQFGGAAPCQRLDQYCSKAAVTGKSRLTTPTAKRKLRGRRQPASDWDWFIGQWGQ